MKRVSLVTTFSLVCMRASRRSKEGSSSFELEYFVSSSREPSKDEQRSKVSKIYLGV